VTLPGQAYVPKDGTLAVPLGSWSVLAECPAPARVAVRVDADHVVAVLASPSRGSSRAERCVDALTEDLVDLLAVRRWTPLPSAVEVHDALEVARERARERDAAAAAPPASFVERAAGWLRGPDQGRATLAILLARVSRDDVAACVVMLGDHAAATGEDALPLLDEAARARLRDGSFTPDRIHGEPYMATLPARAAPIVVRAHDGAASIRLVRQRVAVPLARTREDAPSPEGPQAPVTTDLPAPPRPPQRRPSAYDDPAWALEDARRAPRRATGNLTRWIDPKDP
jgi:hypothetical protein